MKLVTFSVAGPLGVLSRLGALTDQGRIVDLTTAYGTYLAQHTDEPLPRELALVRTPPDMIGWLRGQHKSREAAEQALAFAGGVDPHTLGLDGARLVFDRTEVKLLAPLLRPNSLRDFSIFEEHMTRREGGAPPKRPNWYRWPPYYKGNPGTVSYSCSVDLHRWPQVGQRVKFEVSGIGTLEHTIVAGERGVDYVKNGMQGLLSPPTEFLDDTTGGRA